MLKPPLMTTTQTVKEKLVEAGGRTSQDLGMGRIVGQVLVYLYLSDGDCSLDEIGEDIELSKASASIAARQLEKLGLVKRTWKKGDRKSYYRTADNVETALKSGLLSFILQKIHTVGVELDEASRLLSGIGAGEEDDVKFLLSRVERAKTLRDGVINLLNNPLVGLFTK